MQQSKPLPNSVAVKEKSNNGFGLAEREQFVHAASQAYLVVHGYGEKPADMLARTDAMLAFLEGYGMGEVIGAMRAHVRRHATFPKVADIVNILSPLKPKLDATTYIGLKKRAAEGQHLLRSERAYIENYEWQKLSEGRDGSEELREAKAEVANYKAAWDDADGYSS